MSDGVTVVLWWGGLDDELATRFGGAETFRASHCLIKTIQYFAQTTADCYTGQSCFTEGPRSQLAFIPAVTGQIRALYRRKTACGGGLLLWKGAVREEDITTDVGGEFKKALPRSLRQRRRRDVFTDQGGGGVRLIVEYVAAPDTSPHRGPAVGIRKETCGRSAAGTPHHPRSRRPVPTAVVPICRKTRVSSYTRALQRYTSAGGGAGQLVLSPEQRLRRPSSERRAAQARSRR